MKFVLLPVFALVALTFVLLAALARSRIAAVRRGDVRGKDIPLNLGWPDGVAQIGNSYRSQFELPMLFYVLVAFQILAGPADAVFVALEWAFVASRFAHAYIHVTSNYVPWRFRAFAAGFFLLVAMWTTFAVRIVSS